MRNLLAAVVAAFLCACGGTTAPSSPAVAVAPIAAPPIAAGTHVWVTVAVATLWSSPAAPRPVDAPALSAPVQIRRWLAGMSTSARRGLTGRIESQALYGEPLTVTGVSGSWLHVVAPGQPTHRDNRGYPGWVPRRQVTAHWPV